MVVDSLALTVNNSFLHVTHRSRNGKFHTVVVVVLRTIFKSRNPGWGPKRKLVRPLTSHVMSTLPETSRLNEFQRWVSNSVRTCSADSVLHLSCDEGNISFCTII